MKLQLRTAQNPLLGKKLAPGFQSQRFFGFVLKYAPIYLCLEYNIQAEERAIALLRGRRKYEIVLHVPEMHNWLLCTQRFVGSFYLEMITYGRF